MPESEIYYYKEKDGSVPLFEWLDEIEKHSKKTVEKCIARIRLLKTYGYELRRPYADYLREGIYELRLQWRSTQYRILYFFHGRNIIILSHGLTKKQKVPEIEINKAIERKKQFEAEPDNHLSME